MWCGERDSKCEMIRRIGKMDSAAGLTKWIFLCLCLSRCAYACHILEEPRIYFLNADDSISNSNPGLKTYCHNATSNTTTMHLNISSDSYILYDCQTPDKIYQKYDENDRLSSLNTENNLSDKRKQFWINREETYIVLRRTMMAMGIILSCLSKIEAFYYVCDIIFGVPAIISIYIAKKLIRRGHTMWVKLAASVILFFSLVIIFCILWENMQLRIWLIYILVSFLSWFTICDSFGPVANARTRQNMQWFLMHFSEETDVRAKYTCSAEPPGIIYAETAFERLLDYLSDQPNLRLPRTMEQTLPLYRGKSPIMIYR